MKTLLLINLIFTLLFIFSSNAFDIIVSKEDRDSYDSLGDDKIVKNVEFTGKGRKLDVFFTATDDENIDNKNNTRPVVIHFYGCSWINGNKISYNRIGSFLESNKTKIGFDNPYDYVTVIPDYTMYPDGTMEDMVDDVYNAITWTMESISDYGGNPNNITITAHSSGAHLVALTLVKAALKIKNNGHRLDFTEYPKIQNVALLNGPYIFNEEFLTYTMGSGESTFNVAPEGNGKEEYHNFYNN